MSGSVVSHWCFAGLYAIADLGTGPFISEVVLVFGGGMARISEDVLRDMDQVGMIEAAKDGTLCNIRPLAGVIYVLAGSGNYEGACKIGMTSNLTKRLPTLETTYGCHLDLMAVIWTNDPRYLESEFHSLFCDQRANVPKGTEWFNLTVHQVLWLTGLVAVDTNWIDYLKGAKDRIFCQDMMQAVDWAGATT